MRNFFYFILLALASCATPENLVYFKDAGRFEKQIVSQEYNNRIQKDDLLSVTVNSKNPELTLPFNSLQSATLTPDRNISSSPSYLVDSNGDIVFPIFGKIPVLGLTHAELSALIEQKIINGGYIKDPTVTVKLLNYKISVLGEVKMPGLKKIETERVTVFDALALAGDLTIYGQRQNIAVIREVNGQREVANVDISSKDVFTSDYYYLRPNDIVYVQPNKKQQRASMQNPYLLSTIFSGSSLLVNMLDLLISL